MPIEGFTIDTHPSTQAQAQAQSQLQTTANAMAASSSGCSCSSTVLTRAVDLSDLDGLGGHLDALFLPRAAGGLLPCPMTHYSRVLLFNNAGRCAGRQAAY